MKWNAVLGKIPVVFFYDFLKFGFGMGFTKSKVVVPTTPRQTSIHSQQLFVGNTFLYNVHTCVYAYSYICQRRTGVYIRLTLQWLDYSFDLENSIALGLKMFGWSAKRKIRNKIFFLGKKSKTLCIN